MELPPLYGDDEGDHLNIEWGNNLFYLDYPDYAEVGYQGISIEADIANLVWKIVTYNPIV